MATNSRLSHQPAKPEQRRPPMQPAAYFAFPSGKAVPIQNNDLFKGKTFYVRCDFPDLYLAQFIKDIEALGGSTTVPDSWTADYVIYNPPENDHQWQNEFRRRLKAQPRMKPPVQRPYYWIYACHHAGDILSADSVSDHPVFTKWDHVARRPRPLLVYITVNLPRHGDEDTNDALRAVESTLESLGGFRSATRAHADVLILSLDTIAGQKFKAAAKPDQVIWSPEDFEAYATRTTPLDLGRDQEPRQIVVARTNARSVSAATTVRRTTRKEFTAEDDDLVLRYIAAYDPEKKRMNSKSFYTEMMNSTNTSVTPWVHRHTTESWRERVKKRVAPFKLRVDAYLHENIDRTLRTQEERETGTGPAALEAEVTHDAPSASRGVTSDHTVKNVSAKAAVPIEMTGGQVLKAAASRTTSGKRDREREETGSARDTSEPVQKKQRTTRKGAMPIDERLRHSPSADMEAGPSRPNGESSSTRTRLKPRRSAEGDVFDDYRNTGPNATSPGKATKQTSNGRQAAPVSVTAAKAYLAPASSQPNEEPVRDKSLAALEQVMEDAIDDESVAEGQPDTDDAELEQDLLQHILRKERHATSNGKRRDYEAQVNQQHHATQASQITVSTPSVPDTQAPAFGGSRGIAQSTTSRVRPQNQANDFAVTMTGQEHIDSVQVHGLSVSMNGSGARNQPSGITSAGAVAQMGVAMSTSEIILQTTTMQVATAFEGQPAHAESSKARTKQAETDMPDEELAKARFQTDQEKREELKRIVVGLVQEYDLNYKAMHRLIEECRKRYNYVNQALLRGMIEQALAANARE